MKFLYGLLLSLSMVGYAQNQKISQLPLGNAANVLVTDSFPYLDTSTNATKRLTLDDLINLPVIQLPAHGGTGKNFSSSTGVLIVDAGVMTAPTTLPVAKGGTNAATATAALTNLLPSQTGNAGLTLTTNGTVTAWGTIQGGWNVVSKTSAYTAVVNDWIKVSGSGFNLTLPTAVGASGKAIAFEDVGPDLTSFYLLFTTSSQTIGGVASGFYQLNTFGETVVVVSDGANWQVQSHVTNRGPIVYTMVPQGVSSNPSYGAVGNQITNLTTWTRNGKYMTIQSEYYCTAAGAAGSGAYIYPLPNGANIDLTVVSTIANLPSTTITPIGGTTVGFSHVAIGTAFTSCAATGVMYPWTQGTLMAGMTAIATGAPVINTMASNTCTSGYGNTLFNFGFTATFPIQNWQP